MYYLLTQAQDAPTAWNWSFGDGTYSTIKNPTHTYSAAGNYTVALTVSNSAGSNDTTKASYIKVTANTATKTCCKLLGIKNLRKSSSNPWFYRCKYRISHSMEMEFWRWNIFNTPESKTHLFKSRNLFNNAYSK